MAGVFPAESGYLVPGRRLNLRELPQPGRGCANMPFSDIRQEIPAVS
jgi:hypothetical protein